MVKHTFKDILIAKLTLEFHNGAFIEIHSADLPKILEIVEETHKEFSISELKEMMKNKI